jgi:lipase ATG15
MLLGLPATLQGLISAVLWATTPPQPTNPALTFHLRHRHAIINDSRIVFSNLPEVASYSGEETTEFTVPTLTTSIPRPESFEAFSIARRSWKPGLTPVFAWEHSDVVAPDVSRRSTLQQLAKMSSNSYFSDNSTSEWYDLFGGWRSMPHGWHPEDDGLRGHIFVSDDNSTVVISIKGTSAGRLAGGGGPTVGKDKLNDNLLFSCCCARVGPTWSTVCDCFKGKNRCDSDCVEEALKDDSLFYSMGLVSRTSLVRSQVLPSFSEPL